MEIKLEIGENLRSAIADVAFSPQNPGEEVQKAFGIDFMKLIKEHAEGGDVRVEVKDIPKYWGGYEKLRHILAPHIGNKPEDISNGHIDTLITIAKGIYLDVEFHLRAVELEVKINKEFKEIAKMNK